jgi:hypothetical protein
MVRIGEKGSGPKKLLVALAGGPDFNIKCHKHQSHFLPVLGIGYSGTTRGGGPGGYPPDSTLLRWVLRFFLGTRVLVGSIWIFWHVIV